MQGCNHHNHQLKEKPRETSAGQVKLCSNLGVSRAVFILVILILGMVVLIVIPYWKDLSNLSEDIACEQAMKSARDGLIIEYLGSNENSTVDEAMLALDEIMPARADICPAHGTVYLIRDEHGIYEPICGLHASDAKLRTRLNASRGLDLLQEALRKARRLSSSEPESVEIHLNGKPLECQRVKEEWTLARGTDRTADYEGVIVLYGLAGDGDFKAADAAAVKENEICYFVYADEKYCAVWHASDGWTGDSYNGV